MSDLMTNREIEDVLSSIRRLVSQDRASEEAHVAPKLPEPEAGAREAAAPAAEALVLTPALRVVAGEPLKEEGPAAEPIAIPEEGFDLGSGMIRGDTVLAALGAVGPIGRAGEADDALEQARAWAEAAVDDVEGEASDRPVAFDDGATLEDTIAELEAAVAGIDAEFEPDGSEVVVETVAASEGLWQGEPFGVDEAAVSEPESDGSGSGARDIVDTDLQGPDAAMAPVDTAVTGPGDAGHLAGGGDDWPEAEASGFGAETVDDGQAEHIDGGQDQTEAMTLEGFALAGMGARRLHLASDPVEDIGEHAEAWGDVSQDLHPEDDRDDLSGHPGISEPHPAEDPPDPPRARVFVRRAAETAPVPEVDRPAAAAEAFEAAASDAAFGVAGEIDAPGLGGGAVDWPDRDLLHRLVSEILRQELRGPLGERITQNVRKLVRREIHRALESRDFE